MGLTINYGPKPKVTAPEPLPKAPYAPKAYEAVFKITGKGIARQGYPVRAAGSEDACGVVPSGTRSPKLKEAIALAYVPVSLSKEGTAVDVEIRGKPVAAVVVKTPFIPPATKS